jgi:hypothetical protein
MLERAQGEHCVPWLTRLPDQLETVLREEYMLVQFDQPTTGSTAKARTVNSTTSATITLLQEERINTGGVTRIGKFLLEFMDGMSAPVDISPREWAGFATALEETCARTDTSTRRLQLMAIEQNQADLHTLKGSVCSIPIGSAGSGV